MKYWTVQTKEVLDIINRDGVYNPKNTESRYVKENPSLLPLYNFFTMAYNNGTNAEGLIYTFFDCDYNNIHYFMNIDEFTASIKYPIHANAVRSLWKKLISQKDAIIMELEFSDELNPLWIDINDFQFLMPPILCVPPYTEEIFSQICDFIAEGICFRSPFPSYLIQGHLPYIRKDNIVNIYPVFEI